MGTRYRLYGLTVDSTLPLSCPRLSSRLRPDVTLRAGCAGTFNHARSLLRIAETPQDWFECRTTPSGRRYMRWAGLFEFLLSHDARTIEYRRLGRATRDSLRTYLLGQVLSFSLLSFGYEPLHATSVVIDGEAVAFLGECGYGKSTLGAAFAARGFAVLTDDVLALEVRDGRWIAHAGPPRLKLFPSVARRVLARGSQTRLNPGTTKMVLPLARGTAGDRSVPLRSLYALRGPTRRAGSAPTRVSITPLHGQRAFLEVIRGAFNLIQVSRPRLENQFRMATRLVRDVPLRRLAYPRKLEALDSVCAAVINDRAHA